MSVLRTRPVRHRRTTAVAALAVVALAVPLAAGCGAAEKAVDCARLVVDVGKDVDDLQRAVGSAADDPGKADEALDTLDADVKKLKDKTDNPDLDKVVDHFQSAVANARKAVERNERPDLGPVKDAAGELTKVCTSK
ncbi:hypothetical protein SNS2_1698 [Streptomyces netropsis]|uniref:Outer membrane murein-binding lipoprotein Lpp n=1 Tax=Streptomyces syringium TaxID=76729 RepID=A0ABS4Y2U1_9ACTN|nr:hypothetical protein [Streptomyces syringium]MBP2403082.1 outer membrane murein-binding lipoprotein Lpp [Streptomyces syringium]SPE52019.1 hypothetical protein SNS2_1698 [Streptomyces netropsis]